MTAPIALCFPWYVGAGHTGRLLEVSRLLAHAGLSPLFAYDPTRGMVESAGVDSLDSPVRRAAHGDGTGYLTVTGPDDAFARRGYYHERLVLDDVERDRRLIRDVRPACVVVHMQPTAVLAARAEGVPVLSIGDADFLVDGPIPWAPWLEGSPCARSPFPSSIDAFRSAALGLCLPEPEAASDLLLGDHTLIASIEKLERPAARYADLPGVEFAGPLVWDPGAPGHTLRPTERRGVFATGGGGDVTARRFLEAVDEAVGARADDLDLLVTGEPRGRATQAVPFGGLSEGIAWSDVVVCHGGHSTIIAALQQARPVIVLGAMSENEANGRLIVETAGVGHAFWRAECEDGRIVQRTPEGLLIDAPEQRGNVADALAALMVATAADSATADRCRDLQQHLIASRASQAALFDRIVQDIERGMT